MTEASIPVEEAVPEAQSSPACGAALKAARELKKLSVEDISSRLRLSVHQIRALENDEFSLLPSAATMTRGFIRNYARLLEIDAEPLLQVYQSQASGQTNHSLTIKSENILISNVQKPAWKKYIIASLFIVLLIGVWVIYMDYFHNPAQSIATLPSVQTEAETIPVQPSTIEPMPEPALPVAERDAAEEVIAPPAPSGSSETNNVPGVSVSSVTPEKQVESVKPSVQTLPAPTSVVNQPVAASTQSQETLSATSSSKPSLKIRFTFSEPAWVSVLDADNKEVFNKTGQPGSQEKIEVTPPAKLVIGNANGTHLEVNNKVVDLTPYNKLNVVRLTLE